jgi:hypothetical protein
MNQRHGDAVMMNQLTKSMGDRLQGWVVFAVLFFSISLAQAAPVTAKLDRSNAIVGETVTLILETNDTDQSLETDLSVLQADFDVLNRRAETQMSFVNGRQTASVRVVITLEPRRAGDLLIPALQFPGAQSQTLRLKVAAAPALAPGEAEPVFIEVSVQPDSGPYYVLSQVSLTVRIFYQANLTEAAINPPAPEQASVRLLDEVPYQSDRNGERYRVLERRYAIFPERSGSLTIPPMQLTGRLIERPSDRLWQPTVRGRRVRVESDPLTLEISPRPAEYTGDFWLPARHITLSQQISDSDKLRVGEPVTRTVILDAKGLEEHMLEEPVWPELPATRIYPDQPQGISRDDGEWVLGHKEFRYAVVPEQPGELELPEIRLDWWDTVADRQRTAVLPAHKITVLPSELGAGAMTVPPPAETLSPAVSMVSDGVQMVEGSSMAWKVSTGVLALLWLLTLIMYLRKAPGPGQDGTDARGPGEDEKALLAKLRQACKENDASSAREAMSKWIRRYANTGVRGSMRHFARHCGDDELMSLVTELDASGFSSQEVAAWNGERLWNVLSRWRKSASKVRPGKVGSQPELYPG